MIADLVQAGLLTRLPAAQKEAVYGNRRRVRGKRNVGLQRSRTEITERGFAHACVAGGGRTSHLRGREQVRKRHLCLVAALNLGVIMRKAFAVGTPRALQGLALLLRTLLRTLRGAWRDPQRTRRPSDPIPAAA